MVISRDQNAGLSNYLKIDSGFFEMVEQFKYFGKILTDQNSFQEEMKSRLKWAMLAIFR